MAKSKSERQKPEEPCAGFPLTAHPNGQWCKKIRGKVHFFGVWADPDAALDNYNRQAAESKAGRKPRPTSSDSTPPFKKLANRYLTYQFKKAQRKLITPGWLRDCKDAIDAFVTFVGKDRAWDDLRPDDFGKYRRHGGERL